jgi:hypothetical protein
LSSRASHDRSDRRDSTADAWPSPPLYTDSTTEPWRTTKQRRLRRRLRGRRRIGVCERKRKRNATRHNDGTVTRSTEKTGVQSAAKRLSSRFVSLATVGVVRVGFSTANWLGKSLRSCGKFGRSVACEN